MNIAVIIYIIGWVIVVESVAMLFPALTGLIYMESTGLYYLGVAAFFAIIGLFIIRKRPEKQQIFAREGFAVVGLSWIFLSIIGALPLFISREIPSFTDALFETVSGFTTTGSSILTDVEKMSHPGLLWRSLSHWLGGMGVFVFILSIMPLAGGSNIHLMRAESPGPQVGKLVPKLKDTAKILYTIYATMTFIMFVLLLIAKMPVFDAIITSVGTAGTGGFGIKGDSIGSYSDQIKWIVTVFMALFGINFNFYFFIIAGNLKEAFRIEEVRWYISAILISIVIIAFNIRGVFGTMYECFREAAFQVSSLVTSTGFATTDFNIWPPLSKIILVSLMFMGACAGSTGGGIKVVRYVILFKAIKNEIASYIQPRSVKAVTMDGKPLDKDIIRGVLVFIGAYASVFAVSLLILAINGFDIVTNFTAVVACLSNIGPGLEVVGPAGNFAGFSDLSKFVLIFDMLAGRLEIFPMLILLSPRMWKKFK